MTSAYVNQFHLSTGNSDQDPSHHPILASLVQRPSSFTSPLLFSSADVHGHVPCHGHPYKHNDLVLIDSVPNNITLYSATITGDNNNSSSEITRQPSNDELGSEGANGSLKWMPSKMRWMKKMLAPDKVAARGTRRNAHVAQDQQLPSQDSSSGSSITMSSPTDVIRVCSDCNTTKTPLWRSGPQGPKSLCNACGIRQRKARRAMAAAAAAAAGGGAIHGTQMPGKVQKDKMSEGDCILPFKKRCKITNNGPAQKKLKFEDNDIIRLSINDSAVHRVLPQDERDAAILLMALSCGIMYG